MFIVADGMGGHADGEVASRMAVDRIRNYIKDAAKAAAPAHKSLAWLRRIYRASAPTPLPAASDALETALRLANKAIFELGQESAARGEERPLGTTTVALQLAGERARWAHVGDSRLYRARAGELRLLTADHTVYGEPYRSLTDVPLDLPHTNKLLEAVGMSAEVNITVSEEPVATHDVYFLCSDGIHALVPAGLLREQLTKPGSPVEIGENLIQLALDAGGKDNISAVVVRVN